MQTAPRRYDDIIALAHPTSPRHRPMPREGRAAQFSPFAALSGLDAAMDHTARSSADEVEFSQYADEMLAWNLQALAMQAASDVP